MLRKVKELVILGVVIGLVALAYRDSAPREYPPVTLTLSQVTQREVLDQVAERAGLTVVRPKPESWEGYLDDYELENMPVLEAFNRFADNWKLIGDVLVVTPVHEGLGCGPPRMEYILDDVPALVLLSELESGFPQVVFTPHPTLNGFYASGGRAELLEIKRLLNQMEGTSMSAMVKRKHKTQHFGSRELEAHVELHFPLVVVRSEQDGLSLEGLFPETVEALLFLQDLDRQTITVPVSLEQLRQAPPTCRYFDRSLLRVDCNLNCQGPLHLLGLQRGDVLEEHRNDDLRDKPEWWVKREGRDYRIVLHVGR